MAVVFTRCTMCGVVWETREAFLSDPAVRIVGYQANMGDLAAGPFLFNHEVPGCGTTLAIEAGRFADMHDGPIFRQRLTGTESCEGYCQHEDNLQPCPNHCECAYVRDVLQKVVHWPKRRKEAAHAAP